METSTSAALSGCVLSLRSSMQLLESSISILDSGVYDYPRLSSVLQTTRHFELVSESSLLTAQSALLSELQPEVHNLLGRVETYLDKLERREKSLMAKAELQEGRISNPGASQSTAADRRRLNMKSPAGKRAGAAGGTGADLNAMKLQQLKLKKERLSYAVGRLELQAGQKQRQLRKSMAAQGGEF
jgi:DASH complex subunit SPC19